jgi:dienelactone hydrolase
MNAMRFRNTWTVASSVNTVNNQSMHVRIQKKLLVLALLFLCSFHVHAGEHKTITFSSEDGLLITADVYAPRADPQTPVIVLFHQAGSSRGEYSEIAPRLNALGFNCLAVDQRSGDESRGIVNETAKRARDKGLDTHYNHALPDIITALRYARQQLTEGKVISWGSSYSAALVLKLAGDRPELADASIAFSPGEYFPASGKTWVQDSAKNIHMPVFITSARSEAGEWSALFSSIPASGKTAFIPEGDGKHGSRALWKKYPDSTAYWSAVTDFLTTIQ